MDSLSFDLSESSFKENENLQKDIQFNEFLESLTKQDPIIFTTEQENFEFSLKEKIISDESFNKNKLEKPKNTLYLKDNEEDINELKHLITNLNENSTIETECDSAKEILSILSQKSTYITSPLNIETKNTTHNDNCGGILRPRPVVARPNSSKNIVRPARVSNPIYKAFQQIEADLNNNFRVSSEISKNNVDY
jgi:hypothetical protein